MRVVLCGGYLEVVWGRVCDPSVARVVVWDIGVVLCEGEGSM